MEGQTMRAKMMAALRESEDLDERRSKVRSAVEAAMIARGHPADRGWMEAYYDDFAIYRADSEADGPKFFKFPYTVSSDESIELGDSIAVSVETQYTPITTQEAGKSEPMEFKESGRLIAVGGE